MSIPFDRVIVLDAETAWSSKPYVDKLGNAQPPLTLSKQTTEEYLRDPRFKAWGLCWKDLGAEGAATWVRRDQLHEFFKSIDWSRTAVLAHNSQFDIAIMEWIYDAHPVFIFDSLSMARALYGVEAGNSLAKLAERFELPPKGKAVHSTDGILDELPFDIETELADYCRHDVFLAEEIFKRLAEGYPRGELELIDITIKMFTQPRLELDAEMLEKALGEERVAREELLTKLAVTDADLASNDRFAEILEKLGAIPPRKPKKPTKKTPNPVGELYAFAKTDAMFQAMLNGDNEDVALLCEARLKVKSTQERTRAQRFLDISMRGTLPMPLNYGGTQTLRWAASKGSQINVQNMKRGSFLRKAIMAPKGHQIVVSDLSQIEPRVLAKLSGYQQLLDIFAAGKDAYAEFGATMFNKPGLNKVDDPLLRQSAKSALLGCLEGRTPVLTPDGWKPIVSLLASDLVWDGDEWVHHKGLLHQGEKDVLVAHGVAATADHKVLTSEGWMEWQAVAAQSSCLASALSLATLPAPDGNVSTSPVKNRSFPKCDARADGKDSWPEAVSTAAALNSASDARTSGPRRLSTLARVSLSHSRRGLLLANLLALNGLAAVRRSTRACAAAADGKVSWRVAISRTADLLGATDARSEKQSRLVGNGKGTTPFAPIVHTGTGCLTESALLSFGAQTQKAPCTQTTEGVASQFTSRGSKIASAFLSTWSRLKVGTNRICSSIAFVTQKATSPATFAFAHAASTWPTSARSPHAKLSSCEPESRILKKRTQTYDIAYAGPRNRYTILTDAGPIIVHNCGYYLGWASFATQLLVGFLGAPPVRYDRAFAKMLGVTQDDLIAFATGKYGEARMDRMAEIPHLCTDEELFIHCVCAKRIIDTYRATASPVTDYWAMLQDLIETALYGGEVYEHMCLRFEKERIVLPNGMALRYPDLQSEKDGKGNVEWTYAVGPMRKKLHAGVLAENTTSALSRVVMSDAMRRIHKRYPILFSVHDEVCVLVPDHEIEEGKAWIHAQMLVDPKYLPGIPLGAETGAHRRYGLAKA